MQQELKETLLVPAIGAAVVAVALAVGLFLLPVAGAVTAAIDLGANALRFRKLQLSGTDQPELKRARMNAVIISAVALLLFIAATACMATGVGAAVFLSLTAAGLLCLLIRQTYLSHKISQEMKKEQAWFPDNVRLTDI